MVEDYELVARMYRYAGDHDLRWRFAALGAAQAHTEVPGTVAAFLRQRRRWLASSCRRTGGTAPWSVSDATDGWAP